MSDFLDPSDPLARLRDADPARAMMPLAEPWRIPQEIMVGARPAPAHLVDGPPVRVPVAPHAANVRLRVRAWKAASLVGTCVAAAVVAVAMFTGPSGRVSLPRIPLDGIGLPAPDALGPTAPGAPSAPGAANQLTPQEETSRGSNGGTAGADRPRDGALPSADAAPSATKESANSVSNVDTGANPPSSPSYVLAPGVDIPAGTESAWRWATPSRADVRALADALEVPGAIVDVPAGDGGGWRVGATLSVMADGWWFYDSSGSSGEVPTCSASGTPSVQEASAQQSGAVSTQAVSTQAVSTQAVSTQAVSTQELSSTSGCTPTPQEVARLAELVARLAAIVTVEAAYDVPSGTYVLTYLVDKRPSGVLGNLSVGAGVYRGGGTIAHPEFVGRYPTLSARDALARLGNGVSASATNEVVLVSVERVLVALTDVDGRLWSLPGYRYWSADGVAVEVQAVEDLYLASTVSN